MLGLECSSPRFAPTEGMEIVVTAFLTAHNSQRERRTEEKLKAHQAVTTKDKL